MKGRFLLGSNKLPVEGNIYADRSSLILDWLLRVGIQREGISLREVATSLDVSVGLVQKVFAILVLKGLLHTEGVRTAKRFFFKKSNMLLKSWLENYNIVKKCKMLSYRSGLQKEDFFAALRKSNLSPQVALALHSAAEAYGCKNTNLDTFELYVLDFAIKPKLEDLLQLEPQERGYEVLLIQPYYKSLLTLGVNYVNNLKVASPLLTFLDLYHFPLRGQEQAEFMADHIPELKRVYKGG
jgi:hypothetical protein